MSDREQFLLERKQGIGGSDLAAVMGLSPWKTPLGVYLDKVSDIKNDNDDKHLKRGRRLERYILEEYAEDKKVGIKTDLPVFRDKDFPFLIGHIDGEVKEIDSAKDDKKVYVEAKSYWGNISDWDGKIPDYYLPQVAHYAYLTDADRIDVAVLGNRWEYGCFSYYRNEEYEKKVKKIAIDFWNNHVLAKVPPKISSKEDAMLLYPEDDKSVKQSSREIDKNLILLAQLQSTRENIEKQEELLKTNIKGYMESASILTSDKGYKVTWKMQIQHRVNIDLLKKEEPEVYHRFVYNLNIRPFKFQPSKLSKEKL